MSLPTTDPRAIPTITSVTKGEDTIDGRHYTWHIIGDHISIFCNPWVQGISPVIYTDYADLVYFLFDKDDFYFKAQFYFEARSDGGLQIKLQQPLGYEIKTAPCIIYAYARWRLGIDVADIDSVSFEHVDSWCLGNNYLFSPSFIGESSLDIMRQICEASNMVFLYINGAGKLGCGYLSDEPFTPDWSFEQSDWISIKSCCEIQDRETPAVVKFGWDGRHILPGSPKFGWGTVDVTASSGESTKEPYESRWVDHGVDWPGSFTDFGSYVRLEVEFGPKAWLMDMGEAVQITHPALGLTIEPGYPDYFRVHKIRYHLRTMTATVTLIKSKIWNII